MHKRYCFKLSVFLLFAFLFATTLQASGQHSEKKMDIYLCIGQSNMAGRAAMTQEAGDITENIYLLDSDNEFEKASGPLNKYSTIRKGLGMQGLNPAWSFSRKMAETTGRQIGLVVNARGGTPISLWMKGNASKYYEEILKRARIAQKYGKIKGIIWHQGESDLKNEDHLKEYKELLARLVNDLRKDLGIKKLPFVAGQIGFWVNPVEKTKEFNEMIIHISSFIPHTACAASEGLLHRGDRLHFGTEAQLQLGERYADEMLKLQKVKIKK